MIIIEKDNIDFGCDYKFIIEGFKYSFSLEISPTDKVPRISLPGVLA